MHSSPKQQSSLCNSSFFGFLGTLFLGAFNDNVFKILIICFAGAVLSAEGKKNYIPLASGLFSIPYLLFSSAAGYLADRFSKHRVFVFTKAAEILIMLAGWLLFLKQSPAGLLGILFLMGAQSAFFGPAKYGYLPEALPESKLSLGNGFVQLATFLAIILGGWAGSALPALCQGSYALAGSFPILFAILGFGTSLLIRQTRPGDPKAVFSKDPLTPNWRILKGIYREDRSLLFCFLGNTYFWFLGALFLANIPFLVQDQLHTSDGMIGYLQGMVSLGIGIGATFIGFASRGYVGYRFVIPSAWLLAVTTALFGMIPMTIPAVFILSAFTGITAGAFQLPLSTGIQQRSPRSKIGAYIAAGNVLDCVSMVLASIVHWLLIKVFAFSPAHVIMALGFITAIVSLFMMKAMPDELKKEPSQGFVKRP